VLGPVNRQIFTVDESPLVLQISDTELDADLARGQQSRFHPAVAQLQVAQSQVETVGVQQRGGPASSHGGSQQHDGSVPVQSVEVRQHQRDEPQSVCEEI